MTTPFDFIGSINDQAKPDLFRTADSREQIEKDYVPFIVNRGFSFYPDTILYANEVNTMAHIEKIAQYDFLRLSIRPRKRWSKWFKSGEDEDLEVVKQVFGYSTQKAREVLKILTRDQLDEMQQKLSEIGGVK